MKKQKTNEKEKKRNDDDNSHLFILYRLFRFPPFLSISKIIIFTEGKCEYRIQKTAQKRKEKGST